jgi:hypothetical protein
VSCPDLAGMDFNTSAIAFSGFSPAEPACGSCLLPLIYLKKGRWNYQVVITF